MKIEYTEWREVELISHYDSKEIYDRVMEWIKEDMEEEEKSFPSIEKITEDLLVAILTEDASCEWTKNFIVEHCDSYNYTLYNYLYDCCIDAEYDLLIDCEQKIGDYGDRISSAKRKIIEED